ncbi:hypothetical protein GF351_02185 [Candidatus Woesearchaeota archaeon]|nr:hypothetical protein [Candidatus Woesearchaeota archaeon]
MKTSTKKGLSFGLTSGIITTLGLIVGLEAGTHSKGVVLGGIIVIAVADGLSDSLGIHISEESGGNRKTREVWESTAATFFSKMFFALTFAVPILLLQLRTAIIASVAWGLALIALFSYSLTKKTEISRLKAVLEHIAIAVLVIISTHWIGQWIGSI